MNEAKLNWFDRVVMFFAPKWGAERVRARVLARHFEAAAVGRRADGWERRPTDANAAASGATLSRLRSQARDLVRNNPWARQGLRLIATDVVGWGIKPKPRGKKGADRVAAIWKKWGETTQCDAAGKLTFYGLQWLVMRTVAESGEALVRRRMRRPDDGLAVPMQLQVLEPDYLDTSKDGIKGEAGGDIVQGIEFDMLGRRAAYWLFDTHPGSRSAGSPVSKRYPADQILHVYDVERPGQVRGPSWFASVDVRLHEFDEYEDATLMKQKIAACLAAFVTDIDGDGSALGRAGTDQRTQQPTDSFEPGMIVNLPQGKQVTVANPPAVNDHQSFSTTSLRGVAAGLGVTYEGLTGDYSNSNYSSARMGRNVYTANVEHWRWKLLIPQFCDPVWMWMLDALIVSGEEVDEEPAQWTPPPLPMLDPEKESAATTKAVRAGQQTHDDMVREQGHDPDEFWEEYAASLERLDKYGIVLDSDPRKTSAGGQAVPSDKPDPAPSKESKPSKASGDDGDTAGARHYDEIRNAWEAARDSEQKRAEDAIQRLAEETERFRTRWEARERSLDQDLERIDEDWQRCLAEVKERHNEAMSAALAEHARELAARDALHGAHLAQVKAEAQRDLSMRDAAMADQRLQHHQEMRELSDRLAAALAVESKAAEPPPAVDSTDA